MPKPRKAQVSLEATPYYHCVSRCVRRAFLCGEDNHTGQSFEHRRQSLQEKMSSLAKAFALDICAYAVMSNHSMWCCMWTRSRPKAGLTWKSSNVGTFSLPVTR